MRTLSDHLCVCAFCDGRPTAISGRPVVEMSESVSGQVWVAMTTGSPIAGVDNAEATPTGGANDTSSANASTDSSSGASSSRTSSFRADFFAV